MRHSLFIGSRLPRQGRSVSLCALLALFVLIARTSNTSAEEFEQHHAHEHGKVTLNVAVEGTALVVELEAPAANVVGFEYAPRTAAERSLATNAAALLRNGRDLVVLPAEAQCRFEKTELTEPTWGKNDHAHEGHETAHDKPISSHGGHDDEHESHADYEARLTYRCAQPTKLAWFEPALLSKLPNLTEAQVNLITPTGQRSEVVKSARTRIALRGS